MDSDSDSGTITKELTETDQARIEHALVELASSDDSPYPTNDLYNLAEYIAKKP